MNVHELYEDHPISAEQVLASVRARGAGLAAPLTAEDLFDFDQDHYGGIAAVDTLARRAGIGPRARVLDVCAGLAGPARFLAARRGCTVVAIELHAGRARGARRLTTLVGLGDRVRVVRGDATRLPLRARSFDACLSQEALLHVEDKAAVLAECRRALRPGGRLAFTDWIAHPRLGDRERARLGDWMAARSLQTLATYRTLLGRAGFTGIATEEVTGEWRPVLRDRAARYRALARDPGAPAGASARGDELVALFAYFLRLVEEGKLGGGRFVASA